MSGYFIMLELSIISYISILFLIPILNHPGQCRVTQASLLYLLYRGKVIQRDDDDDDDDDDGVINE